MSTLAEVTQSVTDLTSALTSIDSKLDEVRAFIGTLQAGVVTQAQLDELASKISDAKNSATAVLAEADALDSEPTPA